MDELRTCEGRTDKIAPDPASPLLKQATAFASYLNPPTPPVPQELPPPRSGMQPAPRPPAVTPKFVLLSTSCYRFSPERSLALIAEPGKGGCWVKKGERVGYLIVEDIKDGAIVCRDGNQLREIAVTMKETPALARPKSNTSVAMQSIRPDIRSMSVSQLGERGTGVPDVRRVADEGVE